MLVEYVEKLANQLGIQGLTVAAIEDWTVFSHNTLLLQILSGSHLVSLIVDKTDLDNIRDDGCCERLESKMMESLARLKHNHLSEQKEILYAYSGKVCG